MAKRRTRKEKSETHYPFVYNWEKRAETEANPEAVKRQISSKVSTNKSKSGKEKSADLLDKDYNLASIKKSIRKSLFLSALIIAIEVMLYFAWK